MKNKKELRIIMRNKKREYSQKQLEALSLPIIDKILAHPRVNEASTILLYYSLPDEVNTHELIDTFVSMGKTVLLPKVVSDTEMTIHQYRLAADLTCGAYGILEPNTPEYPYTLNHKLLTIIVPGMAFDRNGHRLGRGKGYYDRLLSSLGFTPYKIGVCFDFQIVENVPFDEHDILMNEIISG